MRIAFLGDIALFKDRTLASEWNVKVQRVANVLQHFDLVVANLEVPITNRMHTRVCKGIHLKTSPAIIDVLKALNVGVVSLANNHMCDFGLGGMSDTIAALENAGIQYYGVNGKSLVVKKNGEELCFHGYCCYSANGSHYATNSNRQGIHALTKKRIILDLENDLRHGRTSVLSCHWGDEYSQLPNERQVMFMQSLADKYSFILHGHHTHVMQGVEKYNRSLLAYSQGNFMFDEVQSSVNGRLKVHQSDANKESYILNVTLNGGNIQAWQTIGIFNSEDAVYIIDNREKIKMLGDRICRCCDENYKKESQKMIAVQKETNLGKRDIKWLLGKLNYYSIGAKLLWYKNDYLYKRAY